MVKAATKMLTCTLSGSLSLRLAWMIEHVVVDNSNLTYVFGGIGDNVEEMVSCVNGGGGGLEEIFTELAPEGV